MQSSKPVVLLDLDDTMFDTYHFIQTQFSKFRTYPDVMMALEELSKIAIPAIFSMGIDDLQKSKLEETGIVKYFKPEDINIFLDKQINFQAVVDKYADSKIFLAEDRIEVLYAAKKQAENVFVIWVKRGRYAPNQKPIEGFKPDAEVENLTEVVRIVKSNL